MTKVTPELEAVIVALRKKNLTYREIASNENVPVSVQTVWNVCQKYDLSPIQVLKRLHAEILERETAMGLLDVEPMNEYKIEGQNKLGDEITDILWEVRAILFEL
jgi:glycine cleavage system aminomethyltransferase T